MRVDPRVVLVGGARLSLIGAHHSKEMLEVRPGLLLGSMGDALAVFTRVPSLVARYHVTHVLSLCNDPPEWATDRQPATGESGGEWKDVEDEEAEENKPAEGWAFISL